MQEKSFIVFIAIVDNLSDEHNKKPGSVNRVKFFMYYYADLRLCVEHLS